MCSATARFVACAAVALGWLAWPHDACAHEAASVDDDVADGAIAATEREDDNEAVEDEAFGPRSNLRTRAEEVSFDARLRTLELAGNVRVDSAPFHFRSQHIRLTRTRYGIEIVGKGSLAFCPCLGTPLTVDFDEAIVAPPGDLILTHPTLRLYGAPILPLPYFWLRSDEKFGLLPPDLAYRGKDGFFAGGGVHVPWRSREGSSALDLRGGAYAVNGFAVDARLRTPTSTTMIRYDRLPSARGDDGLLVAARGASSSGELGVAWDADVLRGQRGVAMTTDLDAAARPWDRITAEGALRGGPFVVATAMRAVARRGGGLADIDAAGPVVSLRASGIAGSATTYDATIEGGSLRFAGAEGVHGALSFARAEIGGRVARTFGGVEGSLAVRGAGDAVVGEEGAGGVDRAGSARARLALPLARRFSRARVADPALAQQEENDPWIHVVEPFAETAVLHARGDGWLGLSPARGGVAVDGTAPVVETGFVTTLGRWGSREALEVTAAVGGAFGVFGSHVAEAGPRPLARQRAAASLAWLGASVDAAEILRADAAATNGFAILGRLRLGTTEGVHVVTNVAASGGVDPVLARVLFDAPLEPAAGFLSTSGTTGGAGVVLPWSRVVITSAGADADATRRELVAARAGLELRDRCGCLTLRLSGSHRLGREGVDVWAALDFASKR